MIRSSLAAAFTVALLGSTATMADAQTASSPPPPPPQSASNGPDQDISCRQQAAAETGYRGPAGGNDPSAPPSQSEQSYAAAYYACMSGASGGPPYGYPYPYYYPPFYYGPAVSFGFGFGGFHGRR